MASLTSGGLEIQTSIPTYTNGATNINLSKFQICSITGGGTIDDSNYNGGAKKYTFSGMCIFIVPRPNWLPNSTTNYSPFGSQILVNYGGSGATLTIGALRIY